MALKRPVRRLVLIGSTVMLALGMMMSSASAETIDGLKAHKDDISSAIAQMQAQVAASAAAVDAAKSKVADANGRVQNAQSLVSQAQDAVSTAQADVEKAEAEVAAAQAVEAQKAAELEVANQQLDLAKAKEADGETKITAQEDAINAYARSIVQDNMPMINIAMLFTTDTTASLANRVQWSDTVLGTNQVDLDLLRQLQAELVVARQASQTAQANADKAKKDAADQVSATEESQKKAEDARTALQGALAQQQAALDEQLAALGAEQNAQAGAESTLAEYQDYLNRLYAESDNTDNKIAELYRQQQAAQNPPAAPASSSGLIWPTNGVITDYYGWRTHPVWGTQLFHDGLDIGAGCGKPVYAVASGVVTEEYYSSGYGYRLFINHGWVGNSYLDSSYNHMSGYAVGTGAWVSQGQVIGYIGSTGVSTGCHMHFMLWDGGTRVDPLPYLP